LSHLIVKVKNIPLMYDRLFSFQNVTNSDIILISSLEILNKLPGMASTAQWMWSILCATDL